MTRTDKVVEKLREKDLDLFLSVTLEGSNKTVRYLSNFSGDTGVIIVGKNERFLVVDSRFYTQASQESDFELVKLGNVAFFDKVLEMIKGKKVGIEGSKFSYSWYKKLSSSVIFEDFENEISQIRAVKEPDEVEKIKKAIEVAQNALKRTLEKFHVGMKEREFSALLEYEMVIGGAQKPSFETIVASGYRGALPHGLASDKPIEHGEMVVVDFGALVDGYCSDLTRTFAVGSVPQEYRDAYETVLKAQMTAMRQAHAGMEGREIDAIARNVLQSKGLGKYFSHGLGHAVGMDVHELPVLNPKYDKKIPAGVVVTFEPGVYVPEKFGIRIEDDVFLTENGYECLSSFNKEFTYI